MKKIGIIFFALTMCALAQEPQMRDSTVTVPIIARACVITVSYQGNVVRDTLTPDQVAAWITQRGGSRDTLMPVRDILSHLRAEIGRCHQISIDRMTVEMAGVDQGDSQTLAQIRAARAAIRTRYRQWQYSYPVKVPMLAP